jgi:hypothetical protein
MFVYLVMHDYSDRLYGAYATRAIAEEVALRITAEGYYLVSIEKIAVETSP